MILQEALNNYKKEGKYIRVGLVGAGQMGEGLVCQIEKMVAISIVAIADIREGRSADVFKSAKINPKDIVETTSLEKAEKAISEGKRIATQNADILNHIPAIDIIVEATGVPEIGAQISWNAIMAKKNILQMNVETDATVGYLLNSTARAAGLVYTLTAGDEPGAAMELYDFASTLGFEVVCMGKGKNNPLDRTANPDSVAKKARAQFMNPKMLASFIDGTKTMVEMTSLGNAIGFTPDICGMHGPEVNPSTLKEVYIPKKDGGILNKKGKVEFGIGVAPGVFAIITSDHPKILRDMTYLSMGEGPYFSLFRPYHLTSLETPVSIIRAVIKSETTIATVVPPCCETVTYAKKALKTGESLDALGGYTMYGMIEDATIARRGSLLPLGLAPSATLKKDIPIGHAICYDDVDLDEDTFIVHLRRLQDKMIKG